MMQKFQILTLERSFTAYWGNHKKKIFNNTNASIIIFESTVYPGATEEVCDRIIAEFSGLSLNKDYFLGYSPERINPGDKEKI